MAQWLDQAGHEYNRQYMESAHTRGRHGHCRAVNLHGSIRNGGGSLIDACKDSEYCATYISRYTQAVGDKHTIGDRSACNQRSGRVEGVDGGRQRLQGASD